MPARPTRPPARAGDGQGDYEVGYGRPPRHTRFRKGQSGNPRGRPKGARGFYIELSEELAEKITIQERGRARTVTKQRAVIKRAMEQALQGNPRALAMLLSYAQKAPERSDEAEATQLSADELKMLDIVLAQVIKPKPKRERLR